MNGKMRQIYVTIAVDVPVGPLCFGPGVEECEHAESHPSDGWCNIFNAPLKKERMSVNSCKAFKCAQCLEGGFMNSKWISVKDRLPEVGMLIAVINIIEDVGITTVGRIFRYTEEMHERNPSSRRHIQNCITHWMPLPEPPKEEV